MRVGIVGCGNIAKKHVNFIRQIDGAEIVGVVDKKRDILKSFLNFMKIKNGYNSIGELVDNAFPDVIHILTPPEFHKANALESIKRGRHVYIEKPVLLNEKEAIEVIETAKINNVMICPGYNHLFDPCMKKADTLLKSGKLGDCIYLESHYGMNVQRKDLRSTSSDNKIPWSYELPGGLFHNYMDHPLYLLLKYIKKIKNIKVITSSLGSLPQNLSDEIRVFIEGEDITGSLVLSFNIKPQLQHFYIYGNKGIAKVNFDTMTTITHGISRLPKAASKATFNLNEAFQLINNTVKNTCDLARGKLKPYQGMKDLITEFYFSIENNKEPPIPEDMILSMSNIMDEIWDNSANLKLDFTPRLSRQKNIIMKDKVLITGASGFVGLRIVKKLILEGYHVRAFVRKLSHINALEEMGVEILFGDIRDFISFDQAAKNIDVIVHLATDTSGDPKNSVNTAVTGTKNLIDIAKKNKINKVIYMSSMSVYDPVHAKNGQKIYEESNLEPFPNKRGAYAESKIEAEKLVLNLLNESSPAWVILRPAMIFGATSNMFFGPIGISVGGIIRFVFGLGSGRLRLINVEDVANAVFLCIKKDESNGKLYNIVHEEMITYREYIKEILDSVLGKQMTIYLPYFIVYLGVFFLEYLSKIAGIKPFLTRYRLAASQRELIFDTNKIRNDLSWKTTIPIKEQLKETFIS